VTPEEAESFYEEDEDPAKISAVFDAGPHGITVAPGFDPAAQIRSGWDYIMRVYGRRE
jgi:hypothetical protein